MRGASFPAPGTPANTEQDYVGPTLVGEMVNEGMQQFMSRTKEYPISTVQCWFKSVANAQKYPLNPLPVSPTGDSNPSAMVCYEGAYFMGSKGSAFPPIIGSPLEYSFEFVSTDRFRANTGSYVRRNSWTGPRPYFAAQREGQPWLDIAPACAISGDYMYVMACPDPLRSPASVPAQFGGKLVNPSDEPIFDPQFHPACIEYALWQILPGLGRDEEAEKAFTRFNAYVDEALMFGATRLSGDPEQRVQDTWALRVSAEF